MLVVTAHLAILLPSRFGDGNSVFCPMSEKQGIINNCTRYNAMLGSIVTVIFVGELWVYK